MFARYVLAGLYNLVRKVADEMGINLFQALREHSCFEALNAIGSTVFTGNTGTNLCDLNILYVPQIEECD